MGESVTIAKNNLPLGALAGLIQIPEDFDQEDSVINEMFYGETQPAEDKDGTN